MRISRRAFIRTGLAGGLGVVGVGTYGFAYERHHITLTRAEVAVADLPPALDGVRIGILTDLHHSSIVSQADIAAATRLLMSERPDLIVLLGDYASWADQRYLPGCVEALGHLTAPEGVFAILGNHDDERTTPRALTARGFQVLLDDRTDLHVRGEKLGLAGIRFSFRSTRPPSFRRLLVGSPRPTILLSHDPRRLTEASELGVPLVLSGHTHGGQIVLPLLGAVAARKYPIEQGVLTRGRTTLFVSRGVGTVVVPVRLNCPPEAAVVTLRA